MRRVADGRVMAGERQAPCSAIDAEDGNVVATLIAAVEKPARGVEVEAARVVATGPFVGDELQLAGFANGEDSDAVVQAIARIDKAAIGRN